MHNAMSSSETRATQAVQLANRYLALWNEPDADQRRRMIGELWTQSGSQILQPPMEMREIAASPGLGLAATLEARGHAELEARATASYEHWVPPKGSSSVGAKTPSDSVRSLSSAGRPLTRTAAT